MITVPQTLGLVGLKAHTFLTMNERMLSFKKNQDNNENTKSQIWNSLRFSILYKVKVEDFSMQKESELCIITGCVA